MVAASIAAAALSLVGLLAWRLVQSDYFWRNPLDGARFEKLTDWEGTELDAALFHDGKFVTFLADRDGGYDTFVTQVGSGQFRNLTEGRIPTLLHEMTRTTGFTADGTQVWLRTMPPTLGAPRALSLVPMMGGAIRPFLTALSLNPVWSADGKLLVFHHGTPGDPIMLAEADGRNERQIFIGRVGEHNHFVTFSPDQRYIYFVRCWRSTEADVWRISVKGGLPERLTHHNSHVGYPVLLDNRTLLYRATREDGGWAIYGMDTEHRIPHRLTQGSEEYQSLSASADGRRLVTSVSNPVANLWKVPITDGVAAESAVAKVRVPAAHVKAGRYGAVRRSCIVRQRRRGRLMAMERRHGAPLVECSDGPGDIRRLSLRRWQVAGVRGPPEWPQRPARDQLRWDGRSCTGREPGPTRLSLLVSRRRVARRDGGCRRGQQDLQGFRPNRRHGPSDRQAQRFAASGHPAARGSSSMTARSAGPTFRSGRASRRDGPCHA